MNTAEAKDECFAIVAAVRAAGWPGLLVRWAGVVDPAVPPTNGPWWLPSMLHYNGRQGSLSCEDGVRRWRRNGAIFVQCFAPIYNGKGVTQANEMACAVRDAFQGAATAGGVWFRNATTREVGPDASWYQVNAEVDFQYDEMR